MGPSTVTLLRPVKGRRWKYVYIERSRLSALSMTTAGRWKQQNGLVIASSSSAPWMLPIVVNCVNEHMRRNKCSERKKKKKRARLWQLAVWLILHDTSEQSDYLPPAVRLNQLRRQWLLFYYVNWLGFGVGGSGRHSSPPPNRICLRNQIWHRLTACSTAAEK